ncbi:MAG: shikimate dehydrogenase [Succinivibrionaceae bacterium]
MDKYHVLGNPINHSKSPYIHTYFAKQTKQELEYTTLEVPLGQFSSTVTDLFKNQGVLGCNVTVPFKQDAFEFCTKRTKRAEIAGAVNTLKFMPDGTILGDNTDGIGLVTDLKQHNVVLNEKKILILGAGGAARGVLTPIMDENPALIVIANRTFSKALDLAVIANSDNVKAEEFSKLDFYAPFDIIINATSASLSNSLPPISNSLYQNATAYDLMYADTPTTFLKYAKEHGAVQIIDGLGMLVEQAAESFYVWRGVRPSTQLLLEELRHAMQKSH